MQGLGRGTQGERGPLGVWGHGGESARGQLGQPRAFCGKTHHPNYTTMPVQAHLGLLVLAHLSEEPHGVMQVPLLQHLLGKTL